MTSFMRCCLMWLRWLSYNSRRMIELFFLFVCRCTTPTRFNNWNMTSTSFIGSINWSRSTKRCTHFVFSHIMITRSIVLSLHHFLMQKLVDREYVFLFFFSDCKCVCVCECRRYT